MKKKIYLIRHAKASENAVSDLERPLLPDGIIAIARMGKYLSSKIEKVDMLAYSPSLRTQMTAQVLSEQLKIEEKYWKVEDSLYLSSPKHYLAFINGLTEEISSVVIIGHNPSISYLAEYLTYTEIGTMPTASIVAMVFKENTLWSEISKSDGDLLFYESPDGIA